MKLSIIIGVLIRWASNIIFGYFLFQENQGLATRLFMFQVMLLIEIRTFAKVTIPHWRKATL